MNYYSFWSCSKARRRSSSEQKLSRLGKTKRVSLPLRAGASAFPLLVLRVLLFLRVPLALSLSPPRLLFLARLLLGPVAARRLLQCFPSLATTSSLQVGRATAVGTVPCLAVSGGIL